MPFFEESPWLLVPIIIGVVEGWNAIKSRVHAMQHERRARSDGATG